ncbi:metalloendoproteinase 2-MMP-like [Vicia villosa]|uniref:metalloendoproteinase 2-MMP-like n=1 Tax=Vicia villosa TaxID=3911 RepID=UPI00273B9B2F|nr:metalloendoproteinase 2-MMP-like [Vicia villosa]
MKLTALNTFTFLFILSFLFANVSASVPRGLFADLAPALESSIKSEIPSMYLRKLQIEELLKLKYETQLEIIKHSKEKTQDMFEFFQILEKYGFLNSSTSPSNSEDESSIIKFQQYFNLKKTGQLDQNTTDTLIKPRCGVPDIVNSETFKPWWTGKELTYGFHPKNKVKNQLKIFFQDAFNRWSKVTGLNFTETMTYSDSDIKIAFLNLDGEGQMVGATYINETRNDRLMYFDINEQWVFSNKSDIDEDDVDFESAVMHQIGHLLGLEHSSVEEAIMYPIVLPKQKIELVNEDDLQKIQQIYGVQNDASGSSLSVVFWPFGFFGFVVCFLGLM